MEIWCQLKQHINQSKLSNTNTVNVEHTYIHSPLALMQIQIIFTCFPYLIPFYSWSHHLEHH